MIAAPGPAPGDQPAIEDGDAWCWREASRLHREHPAWAIIWLAPAHEFLAYVAGCPAPGATPL